MKRKTGTLTVWAVAALVICSTCSAGCDPAGVFGSNFSLNLIIPLGLGGTPGLYNPFGIVQAAVNAMLGLTSSSSSGTATYPVPSSSTTSSTAATDIVVI